MCAPHTAHHAAPKTCALAHHAAPKTYALALVRTNYNHNAHSHCHAPRKCAHPLQPQRTLALSHPSQMCAPITTTTHTRALTPHPHPALAHQRLSQPGLLFATSNTTDCRPTLLLARARQFLLSHPPPAPGGPVRGSPVPFPVHSRALVGVLRRSGSARLGRPSRPTPQNRPRARLRRGPQNHARLLAAQGESGPSPDKPPGPLPSEALREGHSKCKRGPRRCAPRLFQSALGCGPPNSIGESASEPI